MESLSDYKYSDILEVIQRNTLNNPKMAECKTSTPSWYGALTEVESEYGSIKFGFSYPFEEPTMKISSVEGDNIGIFYIDHKTEQLKFSSSIKKYQKQLPEDKPIKLDKHIDIKVSDGIDKLIVMALKDFLSA